MLKASAPLLCNLECYYASINVENPMARYTAASHLTQDAWDNSRDVPNKHKDKDEAGGEYPLKLCIRQDKDKREGDRIRWEVVQDAFAHCIHMVDV
jgi:hypothetical protein